MRKMIHNYGLSNAKVFTETSSFVEDHIDHLRVLKQSQEREEQ